jgi:hypothetical protein
MQREEDNPLPKVYRLIVDNEEHIEHVKDLVGISHHMTDEHFFNLLECIAREYPIDPPIRKKVKPEDCDDTLPELPSHVMTAMETVRKRRHLTLNLPYLLSHWPEGREGHPNILVVSVTKAPGGYVNLVPEALNFMVDAVLQIRNNKTVTTRNLDKCPLFEKAIKVFPVDMSVNVVLR